MDAAARAPITAPFRTAALNELRALPDYRVLKFLELGCGDGFILEALRRDGVAHIRGTTYRAKDTDYIRTREHPEAIADVIDGGIDLNRPLPYGDASFDVVYSTEVIEHVEGHRNMITEAARVLRPGGWFVLTTPNLNRVISRAHFFVTGLHLSKMELIPYTAPVNIMEQWHHRPVDFPVLHYLLWRSGLRVRNVRDTHIGAFGRVASWLRPVLAVATRRAVFRFGKQSEEDREGKADLVRWMSAAPLLRSDQMCIVSQKLSS